MAIVTYDGTNYDLTDGLLTNANEFTFQDLADNSVDWAGWTSWDGFGLPTDITPSTTLTFNTDEVDLGSVKTVIPSTIVDTNTDTAHTVTYLKSDDDSSYSEVSAGAITARYIKTKVVITNTTARPGFTNLTSNFTDDEISETIVDVAVIHDTQDEFEVPITKTYSTITGVVMMECTGTRAVVLEDTTATAPKISIRDLDTFGKVTSDTTVSIKVFGLPAIQTLSNGDITRA